MARVEKLEITGKKVKPANVVSAFLPETEVYLSLEGLIDKAKEIERLKRRRIRRRSSCTRSRRSSKTSNLPGMLLRR